MKNDIAKVLLSEQQLQKRVKEMGEEIARDYADKNPTMVCILKGAVMFYTDLLRSMQIPLTMDFMAVSSYGNKTKSSGEVEIRKDLSSSIENRHVIIVEDIVDTKFADSQRSSFDHCLFWSPYATGDKAEGKLGSNGNIWGDPQFVDPDLGDFSVAQTSPCVDAGDGTVAPELDYYGQPRMDVQKVIDTGVPDANGVCPDIGIYEVSGEVEGEFPDLIVTAVSAGFS